MGECPICGAEVNLENDIVINELVDCVECGSELEVANVGPVVLIEAPQEAEDWGE